MSFTIPGKIWLRTIEKKVCAHLRIPRSGGEDKPGTSHPRFKVSMTSADAVRFKCEQAGIPQAIGPNKKSDRNSTVYEGQGPMMAYHFCQTQKYKKLGQGSGALMAPGKFRTDSDTLVFAVPPITVTHNAATWVMTVDFYLCVFNGEGNGQTGRITLPPNPNILYGTQNVEALFERTAIHILGEMRGRRFPLSANFKNILGSDFETDSEEEEPEPRVSASQAAKAARAATRSAAWTARSWKALKLTGSSRLGTSIDGAPERLFEVVWSGKWKNTWEPASCLAGWESEMEDAELEEADS